MGCRLPGGIDSPDMLWEALLRGDDLITEIPADRWDVNEHYDPQPGVPGRSVSRWGGFIDDVGGFDAEFFGIGDREAAAIDPQHRLMMETAWEAVEHAGLAPSALADSLTGVFAGLCHDDYTLVTSDAGAMEGPYGYTCTPFSMASGRIAYALGLRGPAYTVDSSCSSGLLAVHLACRSLHEGESDYALAGGCQVVLEPAVSASASAQGMLSPTGRCHAFDVAADGTLGNGRVFAKVPSPDGMKVDTEGNVYCTSAKGVMVFDRDGKLLGTFSMAEQPANCAFGDADWKALYMTCRSGLYRVRLSIPGIRVP